RQFVTQTERYRKVGFYFHIILEIKRMCITIPMRERIARAYGRSQQKTLAVAVRTGTCKVIPVGEGHRSTGVSIEETPRLLTPNVVPELDRVPRKVERRHMSRVQEKFVCIRDTALG